MGKPRKGQNKFLPEHVYCLKGKYIYKRYRGTRNGKSLFDKEIVIGPDTMPLSQMHLAVEAFTDKAIYTVAWMVDQYVASEEFSDLSEGWKQSLRYMAPKVKQMRTTAGGNFGDVNITLLTPAVIKRFLSRFPTHGTRANVRKLLSGAWTWARQYYDVVPVNICREVRDKKPKPRDRYVTPEEYLNVFTACAGLLESSDGVLLHLSSTTV